MKINNNQNNQIQSITSSTANKAGKMQQLTAEEIGKYIQKNIRIMICDQTNQKFPLPEMNNYYIDNMSVKVQDNEKGEKTVLLAVKGNDRPEIAVELASGNYENIVNCIDRHDFVERFEKTIKDLEDVFMYS